MINVTKTYLPNKEKYKKYVDQIYANGTIALQIAYRALAIEGDVITTPFSFVASTSSLVANGLNPIFADINSYTLNIDSKNM